ncbi:MAG: TetR/AcrR family transcriptional regulator [Hyphomonadaceae bacterium]
MPEVTTPRMADSTGLLMGLLSVVRSIAGCDVAVGRPGRLLVSGVAFCPFAGRAFHVYADNMKAKDNTVNIKSGAGDTAERYHHGDLRRALIEKGLQRLAEGPADGISLRELARSVGVSATAVYRHFPDKAALLGALSLEGDHLLAEAFRAAMAKERPGLDAFDAMGRAYVRFALANPALFRLMMSPVGARHEASARGEASTLLVETLQSLGLNGKTRSPSEVKRVKAWAMVHGLAMLMLDGLVPADEKLIDKVISADLI